jgi:hypothetical protein
MIKYRFINVLLYHLNINALLVLKPVCMSHATVCLSGIVYIFVEPTPDILKLVHVSPKIHTQMYFTTTLDRATCCFFLWNKKM